MNEVNVIDSRSFEKLFRDHFDGLCRYAFTILKDQSEAEDVVQKLFIKLWEKRNELEILSNIKSYLYRSVHNTSLNEIKTVRRKMYHVEIDDYSSMHASEDTSSNVLSSELEERIESAMQSLPEKCGEVFRLSRFKELSYKEISEQLNVSIKTVENHMGKALKIMRIELQDYLPELVIFILLIKGW